MKPLQDIRRGTSFPSGDDRQTDGSLFIRTDMDGCRVFQYDAKNETYFQVDGIDVRTTISGNTAENE